jgi:hypothetical protein
MAPLVNDRILNDHVWQGDTHMLLKGTYNAMPFQTADCMATKTNDDFHTYLQARYPEFEPKKNSSRLSSLYSDFSSLKETNSYGYEANVSFWRSLILQASRDGKISFNGYTIAVSKEGLENALEYKKLGQPLGIHNVLVSMPFHIHVYAQGSTNIT